jgi:hypothetical protein
MNTTSLKNTSVERLKRKLAKGLEVWRGINGETHRPSDPGDFGQGTYYSTSKARARCYGKPKSNKIELKNPLILTDVEAYNLIADRFGTISGTALKPEAGAGCFKSREQCAMAATNTLKQMGFDGVVSVNPRFNEIEIVVFPK